MESWFLKPERVRSSSLPAGNRELLIVHSGIALLQFPIDAKLIWLILITFAAAALFIYLVFFSTRKKKHPGLLSPLQEPHTSGLPAARSIGHEKHPGPVCDVCCQPLDLEQAYLATTEQVVTRPEYWEVVFNAQWAYVHQWDMRGKTIGKLAERQANIASIWGLCESCSCRLPLNLRQTHEYRVSQVVSIPTAGPTDPSRTAAAAAAAWMKLYGSFPDSVRFE
jgi:hypothetical protein